MVVKNVNYRGRKGLIGTVVPNDEGLAFFAGYHSCPGCGTRGKILMNMNDIRELVRKFGGGRESVGVRITRRLSKHYGL